MMENRVARGKRSIPTSGKLPYGRIYNKDTGEWSLDQEAVRMIKRVADEFLSGGLWDIAKTTPMSYVNLLRTLKNRCGDKWTIAFEGEEIMTYDIPSLLPEDTIKQILSRVKFNRRNNRHDIVNKYVLSEFIYCDACGLSLHGRTEGNNQYYMHTGGDQSACMAFSSLILAPLEMSVFTTIMHNTTDYPNFLKAISESLPDEQMVKELESKISEGEQELKKIQKELDKLVEIAMSGTLNKQTIQNKEKELLMFKTKVTEQLEIDRNKLTLLPDINEVKKQANRIRHEILEKYSLPNRPDEMSFEEKRNLLHWLFDGNDSDGKPYGIYIRKTGTHGKAKIEYTINGMIQASSTVKKEDYSTNNAGLIYCKKQFKLRKFTHNNKIFNHDTIDRGHESSRV